MIGPKKGETITTPAASTRKNIHNQFAIMKHKRQLLTILTLLFICVIGWAVVSLFSTQGESKVDAQLLKLAQPLVINLDLEVLNSLESKRSFSDEELQDFPIYRLYTDPRSKEETVIRIDDPLPDQVQSTQTRSTPTPVPILQ